MFSLINIHAHSKVCKALIGCIATAYAVPFVFAADLKSSFDSALNYDPALHTAILAHNINLTRIPQVRSTLLPAINLTTQNSLSSGSYNFSASDPLAKRSIRSNTQTFQVNFGLYRPAQNIALSQAELQAKQTLAQIQLAEQDLMQRLLQAYVDLQIAQNQKDVIGIQFKLQELQLSAARRGLLAGVKTLPDVYDAQSKLGILKAQVVETASQWRIKRQELAKITGESVQEKLIGWPALNDNFNLDEVVTKFDINTTTMIQWVEYAKLDAPAVRVQAVAVEIALREIEKSRAAHLPTVDLTLSHSRSGSIGNSSAIQNYDSFNRATSFGVQLTLPLYAGGGTTARVREALSAWEKAQFELESAQLLVEGNATQAFENILAATAQIQALQAAIESAQLLVQSITSGVRLGTHTLFDVATAEQQLSVVRKDWRKARYDFIIQSFKLKGVVGSLERGDFIVIDQGFQNVL